MRLPTMLVAPVAAAALSTSIPQGPLSSVAVAAVEVKPTAGEMRRIRAMAGEAGESIPAEEAAREVAA